MLKVEPNRQCSVLFVDYGNVSIAVGFVLFVIVCCPLQENGLMQ